ncbi:MAG: MBOAT family protein [Deltaproteobacteria bacterium]|nr:MBOAT family protein [Deltaproteobacteria bacterium]
MFFVAPALLVAAVVVWRKSWPASPRRRMWAIITAAAFLLWPLLAKPLPWAYGPLNAGLSLAMAIKVVDVQQGRVRPDTLASWWRFVVWFIVPPDTHFANDAADRARMRRAGIRRWGRGVVKAVCLLVLLWFDARHAWPWPLRAWADAFGIYFMVSGLADFVTGTTSLCGFATQEVFAAPFLSRSPGEFWGQRWNLFVNHFFRRHVFMPLIKRGVFRAAAVVFLLSGLAHEYFVLVCVPTQAFLPGYMTAFFVVQGLAVMAGTWWRAHHARFAPAPFKVAMHFAWMACTVWLFVRPIDPVITAFESFVRSLVFGPWLKFL